jgi:cytidine deaminase
MNFILYQRDVQMYHPYYSIIITYMDDILNRLRQIVKRAYAPYSKFKVAAIAITDKGAFEGVNVENSSYSLSLCAERNAIASAITAGAHKFKLLYIYVNKKEVFPCGACLQVMNELFDKDTRIIIYTSSAKPHTYKLSDLLPHGFLLKN